MLSLLPTSTAVTASVATAVYGQVVTFTAKVFAHPPGNGTPTGTVTFHDGNKTLGTAALSSGAATLEAPLTTAGAGDHGRLLRRREIRRQRDRKHRHRGRYRHERL